MSGAAGDDRAAPLERIQSHLERVYDLDGLVRVSDFLLTETEAARLTGGAVREEQVLVRDDGDACALGVYVAPGVLQRLGSSWEDDLLGGGTALQDYCHAAEGVSHFVHLVWSARQDRQVSALDLELQAEVDKGLTCLLTGHLYARGDAARTLLRRLFDGVSLLPGLSAEERERYQVANDLARRYLDDLLPRLRRDLDAALQAVRRFYRMGGADKRAMIRTLSAA